MTAVEIRSTADNTAETRVNVITGFLNAQHAELVDVVIELLADPREWQGKGVWTMQQWLAWRCGVSTTTARQVVDIAGRADDLPLALQSFRDGELSLDQMTAIARRAPWWTDRQIRNLSKMMTVSQIRRTLRAYPFPDLDADGREVRDVPPTSDDTRDGESADEVPVEAPVTDAVPSPTTSTDTSPKPADEWCSFTFGDDGVFRLNLEADFDTGQIIQSSMTEARDRLFHDGQTDVDWVDAIREMAQRSLDGVADPARRSRFKINLHIETAGEQNGGHTGGQNGGGHGRGDTMTDASGWTVPDAIRRHLTCDGLLSPVFVANGVPISVGRTQRIVPDRTRSIIERRDAHRCRVPGCTVTNWLDVHHIIHWEHHGPTDTWNLVLICSHHHRQHHRGHLGITGNADLPDDVPGALEFRDRNGRSITPSGAAPTQPTGPPPEPAGVYEHPLGERLQPECLYFRPPPAHQQELNERIASDRQVFDTHPDLRR